MLMVWLCSWKSRLIPNLVNYKWISEFHEGMRRKVFAFLSSALDNESNSDRKSTEKTATTMALVMELYGVRGQLLNIQAIYANNESAVRAPLSFNWLQVVIGNVKIMKKVPGS